MQNGVHGRFWAAVVIVLVNVLVSSVRPWPVTQSRLSPQLSTKHYINSTGDIPEQRQALLSLYAATNGNEWMAPEQEIGTAGACDGCWGWDSSNGSYCMWPGVLCCDTAQEVLHILGDFYPGIRDASITCQNTRDVLGLFLEEAGLQGMLPDDLVQLAELRILVLDGNLGLFGTWPASLQLPQLLHLDVQDTSLRACQDQVSNSKALQASCSMPAWLLNTTTNASNPADSGGVICPQLALSSSLNSQQSDAAAAELLVKFFDQDSDVPGVKVLYSAGFINGMGCTCAAEHVLTAPSRASGSNGTAGTWQCKAASTAKSYRTVERLAMAAVTITLVALLLAGSLYLLSRAGYLYRARMYLKDRLGWSFSGGGTAEAVAATAGEMTMAAKRSRFPGTPSIALAKGRGVLAMSEVLVTWVATDVEGSTQLWEWDPVVMGAAVEQHNTVLRRLLEQHGGHEVRTDGDSFTLAFHDAADAVAYCIQAQEELLDIPWPKKLLEHPYCAPVRLGEVCAARNPEVAADVISKGGIPLDQQGPLVMSGLRVRMGIATGIPDDIFVHDLTEHVEYRGGEYDLTEDLASIAAGGQIIMGPKTFQRWNRVFCQAPVSDADFNVQPSDASLLMETQQEFGQSGWQTGKLTRISTMGRQQLQSPLQKSGSMLRRQLESFAGFFGTSSRTLNAFGRFSYSGRRQSVEDHNSGSRGSAESERVMMGGDTLLVYSSAGGTKTVGIGRNSAEAQAAAAVASEQDGDMAPPLGQQDCSNQQPAPARNSKSPEQQALPLQPAGQHAATSDSSKSTFQRKVPLPRSSTIGGISFAISTAAAAANRPPPAAAGKALMHGSSPVAKGAVTLQQSAASSRMPAVAAASLAIKGPGYGPILTRRLSKSNRPGVSAGSMRHTKEEDDSAQGTSSSEPKPPGPVAEGRESSDLLAQNWHPNSRPAAAGMLQSEGVPSSQPIAEGAEQSRPVFSPPRSPSQAPPIAMAGTARNSLNIQGSALSVLSSVYSERSGQSVTFGGQGGVMGSQPGWQPGTSNKFLAWKSAGLGHASPAGQQASVETSHAARRNSMTMLFRYLESVAGGFMRGANIEGDRQNASYLVSTTGSSLSTQNRLDSKSTNTRSSIWGSMAFNRRSVGDPMNDTLMDDAQKKRSFETANAVVLDLGYYKWRDDPVALTSLSEAGGDKHNTQLAAAAAAEVAAAEAPQGSLLHLTQVQSQRLAPRMLLFDWPLPATEGDDAVLQQLLPGFLDAPGAASLTFQSMRELMEQAGAPQPAKPQVAIAFVAPHNFKDVQALGPEVFRACQSLFTSVVREVLLAVGGYESKEVGGQVMAAFEGPRQAVEWALALQCGLLQAPWPEQLAQLSSTSTVRAGAADKADSKDKAGTNWAPEAGSDSAMQSKAVDEAQTTGSSFYQPDNLFKGIRARVGIWAGPMDRVLPHGKSGRADYLGPPANRAARMMGAAQGGQVLVEQGIMQQVLAEWESIGEEKANAALAAAAAAKTAVEGTHHKPSSISSLSQPATDVTSSAVAAGTPRRKVAHSPTNLLASRRKARMTRQDDLGIDEPGGSLLIRRSFDAGLASTRRGLQRTALFDTVLDSASLLDPAAVALSPLKTMRRRASPPPAPWETLADDLHSAGAARGLTGSPHQISPAPSMPRGPSRTASTPRRLSPPPAQSSSYASVAGSVASSESDSTKHSSMMRLQLPGTMGQAGPAQILTIAPAAYQPKGSIAAGGSARSTRSTGSSTGSTIVSPATTVMKGRKSLNVAVTARPSIDALATGLPAGGVPVYDRPRQPAAIRQSMKANRPTIAGPAAGDVSGDAGIAAAQARRRSLNIGNQAIDTEDLYRAVEAALAGGPATPSSAARARRRSNLMQMRRFSQDMGARQSVPEVKPAAEPAPGAARPSQEAVASAFTSALYSTAVLRPTPPGQLPPAPVGLGMRRSVSSTTDMAVVYSNAVSRSTAGGGVPLAPDASRASVVTAESASGESNLAQLLPAAAFSGTPSDPSRSQVDAIVSSSDSSIGIGMSEAATPAQAPPKSDYQRQSSNNLLQFLEGNGHNAAAGDKVTSSSRVDRGTTDIVCSSQGNTHSSTSNLSSNVSSSAGGMLRRKPLLSVVVGDNAEEAPQLTAAQKQPELAAAVAAAGHAATTQAASQQEPSEASKSGRKLGQSSSGGRRQKRPAENSIRQVADAVYSYMRQTGSNPGAHVAGQLGSEGKSKDGRPSAPGSKAGQSQDGSRQPAVGSGGVWDAFTNTIKSAVGSRAASGSGQAATAAGAPAARDPLPGEQLKSSLNGSGPKRQRSSNEKSADNPGIIAECFKITPAAASGDDADGVESITMIKYTALKRTTTQEAAQLSVPFAPLLAAAAAAAGVYSSTSSTTGTSSSLSSSIKLHRWAQICVGICVHKVGGFRLKGVDKLVDVVQVMPASLAGRAQLMLPAASTKGKSRCVAPASGLLAECTAFLPDLSQLIEWMSAPLLAQQQAEDAAQQQQERQPSQQQELQHVSYGQHEETAANWQAGSEADEQLHGASSGQTLELASVKSAAALHHGDAGQEDAATEGFILKNAPGLHEEHHDSDRDPGFSIGAYHGGTAGQNLSPSEAASTPVSAMMSSQPGISPHPVDTDGSMAGSNCQDHGSVSSASGGGSSANHLPNYIASGSLYIGHKQGRGSAHVGDLKGPAVLRMSTQSRGQAPDRETIVASEAWSGSGGS